MSEITFIFLVSFLQIILAAGLINVWLVRFHKSTKYRGKGAKNMVEEFNAYGLPKWCMYLVGLSKIIIAGLLMFGLYYPTVVPETLYVLGFFMVGALGMHLKVRDSFVKFVPAILMLFMVLVSLLLIYLI